MTQHVGFPPYITSERPARSVNTWLQAALRGLITGQICATVALGSLVIGSVLLGDVGYLEIFRWAAIVAIFGGPLGVGGAVIVGPPAGILIRLIGLKLSTGIARVAAGLVAGVTVATIWLAMASNTVWGIDTSNETKIMYRLLLVMCVVGSMASAVLLTSWVVGDRPGARLGATLR